MDQGDTSETQPDKLLVRQESQKLRNIIARLKRWSDRPTSQVAEKPGKT